MKNVYPVLIQEDIKENCFIVDIPDFDISTWGKTFFDAIENARDAIGLAGITMEDDGEKLPMPSAVSQIEKESDSDIVTFVDVDFEQYRKENDSRAVRKNCTIPYWLEVQADKAGLNYSAILQSGLKMALGINA